MDRNILDDGLYDKTGPFVRTTKIKLVEKIALIGSASMIVASIFYMYVFNPHFYNITIFISEGMVFMTVIHATRITKDFDSRLNKNNFVLPSFFKNLRRIFVVCVCIMLYNFFSSLGFVFNILFNLGFETSRYYILITLVDGFLVFIYSYYLIWIFKTEKYIKSLNKEKSKKSFLVK